MWQFFKDWPIERKLTAMGLLSTGLALLLVMTAFVINDVLSIRDTIETRIASLADVIGTNSTAALAFKDQKAAAETLDALRQEPHVVSAFIIDAERNTFATYRNPQFSGQPSGPWDRLNNLELSSTRQSHTVDDYIEISTPIILDRQPIGWIRVRSDLTEMDQRLKRSGIIAIIILLVSVLLALSVSRQL